MNKEELLNYKFENLRSIVLAVTGQDVCKTTRHRSLVDARRIFCHIINEEKYSASWKYEFTTATGLMTTSYITSTSIGKFLGRDHATVLHMLKTCVQLLETDEDFRSIYNRVYSRFGKDIYKRLNYVTNAIEQLKEDLARLEKQKDELMDIKAQQYEESNVPRQGVLFEVPDYSKSIETLG
jgi:hypothetical protein